MATGENGVFKQTVSPSKIAGWRIKEGVWQNKSKKALAQNGKRYNFAAINNKTNSDMATKDEET